MTVANPCIPVHETSNFSAQAKTAVTGCRFVAITGARTGGGPRRGLSSDRYNVYQVGHATADGVIAGVAKYDAGVGADVGVYGQPGIVVPVLAEAAITAGQEVSVGTNGQAKPAATGVKVGLALDDAGIGQLAEIKLY